jgi:RNA-directed DNA polymerase
MEGLMAKFNQGKKRRYNPSYRRYTHKIAVLRKQVDAKRVDLATAREEIAKLEKARRPLPAGDPFDPHFKRLRYCRFADDFCIGVVGSKAEAFSIMQEVQAFLTTGLKLKIAEDKTQLVHATEGAKFLGYQLKICTGRKIVRVRREKRHTRAKSVSEILQLHIPPGRLEKFCTEKKYGNYQKLKALHRPYLLNLSEVEIVASYNAELRGLANYYGLAFSVKSRLNKLYRMWQVSLFKTLAAKRKSSVNKVAHSLKLSEGGFGLTYKQQDQTRTLKLFRLKSWEKPRLANPQVDRLPNLAVFKLSKTELLQRLNANQCEYCESQSGPFEVHHVRGLKSLKPGKEPWQQMMIARHRKTMVLCKGCHQLLTAGRLPPKEVVRAK